MQRIALKALREWQKRQTLDGYTLPAVGRITWFDHATAWAMFSIEDGIYKMDVQGFYRQKRL